MNKTELIEGIAADTGSTKALAGRALESVIERVTAALKKGEDVSILGFGTFKVKTREARTGRNPRTGAELKIAARKAPAFVPGKALKDAVN